MNGSQTFRRPSQINSTHQREPSQQSVQTPGAYVPPHLNPSHQFFNRNTLTLEVRYSKEQLLDLFRAQSELQQADRDLSDIFTEGWVPGQAAPVGNGTWSRREESKEIALGPEICWDESGSVLPMALIEMDEEEKEVRCRMSNMLE